jgi:serine/threonine-protein kinase RsbW
VSRLYESGSDKYRRRRPMALKQKNITKKIISKTDNLVEVREFIGTAARQLGFDEEEVANIVLAVDEACTNIIKHAYHFAPDKEIEISVVPNNRFLEVRIFDNGQSFDPAALRAPDLKTNLGKHRRGGLGVYLMKRLMDKVEYHFRPGKRNEVHLVKYLSHSSSAHRSHQRANPAQ